MFSRIAVVCALAVALSVLGKPAVAGDTSAVHEGPWPIEKGRDHQPTEDQLKADHLRDVTPNEAKEVDRLYDELMSSSNRILKEHPALPR